jgi:hypothetical protein
MATVTPGIVWVSGETVTPAKLNSAAAPTVAVADDEITTAKILDANVTTAKILDANVTTAKIADDAVTNDKLSLTANAGEIKKALNADNAPPIFACRAWVNYSTTRDASDSATLALTNRLIRSSGNVTSVLRNGVGDFTITFTTAMPNANYAVIATALHATTTTGALIAYELNAPSRSDTQVRIAVGDNQIDQFFDPSYGVAVAVFA